MLGKIIKILTCFVIVSAWPWSQVQAETNFNDASLIAVKFRDEAWPRTVRAYGTNTQSALDFWRSQCRVAYAEPLAYYQTTLIPNDYYFANQWYLKRIRADKGWSNYRESPDIIIAVIDTGVQISHNDLKTNIWVNPLEIPGNKKDDDKNGYIDDVNGWDFVNNVADPSPKFQPGFTADGIVHGTVVAGVLASTGNNSIGVAGITWRTQIMPLKAIDDRGKTDAIKIVKAINYATDNGANIINLSFTGPTYNKSVEDAIRRAYEAGLLIVAAGGNEMGQGFGQNLSYKPMYQVCHDGTAGENLVVGVAATDPTDKKTSFSGFGKCIDIAAPGLSIYSTSVYAPERNTPSLSFNNLYDGYWSGTSLAVPMVSGALALIEQTNPYLKPSEAVKLLQASADKLNPDNDEYATLLGAGRLNLNKAVYNSLTGLHTKPRQLFLAFPMGKLWQINLSGVKIKDLDLGLKDNDYRIATGNVDGVGSEEFVVTSGSRIKIFDASGKPKKDFKAFDVPDNVKLSLAVNDVNHDRRAEIITSIASSSYSPEIRIYNQDGKLIKKFLAFAPNFRGGVNLSAGLTTVTDAAEIIAAPASNGGPQIRRFNWQGKLMGQFFADGSNLRGAFKIMMLGVSSNIKNQPSIAFMAGEGNSPYLKIFNKKGLLRRKIAIADIRNTTAVIFDSADINNDGRAEIIVFDTIENQKVIKIYRESGPLVTISKLSSDLKINPNNIITIQ